MQIVTIIAIKKECKAYKTKSITMKKEILLLVVGLIMIHSYGQNYQEREQQQKIPNEFQLFKGVKLVNDLRMKVMVLPTTPKPIYDTQVSFSNDWVNIYDSFHLTPAQLALGLDWAAYYLSTPQRFGNLEPQHLLQPLRSGFEFEGSRMLAFFVDNHLINDSILWVNFSNSRPDFLSIAE